MTHKHQCPLTLDYIALLLAAVLWFTYLLRRETDPVVNLQSRRSETQNEHRLEDGTIRDDVRDRAPRVADNRDELCFPDIDKMLDPLGVLWGDFYAVVDKDGRLPHAAALKLLAAVESHQLPPELTRDARAALSDKRGKLLIFASLLPRLVRESRTCCHADAGNLKGPRSSHGGRNRPPPRQAPLVSAGVKNAKCPDGFCRGR